MGATRGRLSEIGGYLLTTERHMTHGPRSWHDERHARDELIWTTSGVMRVSAEGATWTIPAHRAIWVPSGMPHTIDASADTALFATFFSPGVVPHLSQSVVVVEMLPAVREMLLLNAEQAMADELRLRLQRLIIDLLRPASGAQVDLRMPEAPWLLRLAESILDDLGGADTTEDWALRAGVPPRALTRAFLAETGFTPTQWRIRARVRASLILLGSGVPVVAVARRLGYASASTFIDHFRAIMGTTPAAYFVAGRR